MDFRKNWYENMYKNDSKRFLKLFWDSSALFEVSLAYVGISFQKFIFFLYESFTNFFQKIILLSFESQSTSCSIPKEAGKCLECIFRRFEEFQGVSQNKIFEKSKICYWVTRKKILYKKNRKTCSWDFFFVKRFFLKLFFGNIKMDFFLGLGVRIDLPRRFLIFRPEFFSV